MARATFSAGMNTVARQIAVAHGGRLEHAERRGGGALFRLWLPQS